VPGDEKVVHSIVSGRSGYAVRELLETDGCFVSGEKRQ